MAKKRNFSTISLDDPKSNVAEAFRTLRTNIQFSGIDKKLKSLVITSTRPSEGKSTVIVNLAITMAKANQKVLLVDADLRKPTIKKYFDLPDGTGLTSILVEESAELDAIHRIQEVPSLDIITSGPIPPNPSELLSSTRMKRFVEQMKNRYDMVLIDAPPIGVVSDAAIISTIVDGTILVCVQEETPIDLLKSSKESLEKVNANIIGVVLNGVRKRGNKNDYYYYSYEND